LNLIGWLGIIFRQAATEPVVAAITVVSSTNVSVGFGGLFGRIKTQYGH